MTCNGGNSGAAVGIGGTAIAIAMSLGHTCALLSNGGIECWGDNSYGQLGDGTTTESYHPVPVNGVAGATAIAVGLQKGDITTGYTCALLTGGTVQCWGDNQGGALGNGTFTDSAKPVAVSGLAGATAIAAGGGRACALLSDGTVQCWGAGSKAPQAVMGFTGATAIAVDSTGYTCALLAGGTARCDGTGAVPGLTGATAITGGRQPGVVSGDNMCAWLADGSIQCWGKTSPTVPHAASGLAGVTALAVGYDHMCVLLAGGTVQCSGNNTWGQLGNGGVTASTTLVAVTGLTGVTAIAAGFGDTCAVLSGGAVACWGGGNGGNLTSETLWPGRPEPQIGNGTTTPVTVNGLTGVTAISAETFHTCAVLSDGTVACWGNNYSGELGNGSTTQAYSPTLVPELTGALGVAVGGGGNRLEEFTCALLSGGTVDCWGDNTWGQLGDKTKIGSKKPVPIAGVTGATALAAGSSSACVLLAGGTVACWGAAGLAAVPGITGATAITRQCALLSGGTVKCWGVNSHGELGNPNTGTISATPVDVVGVTGATALATGYGFNCALLADGTVKCWGINDQGQVGDGTKSLAVRTPVTVACLSGATAIAAGGAHACAVVAGGAVQCWGNNGAAQLGNGTKVGSTTPVAVTGLTGVKAITAGNNYTCALLLDGTVACWGDNFYGQLANGATTPVKVLGL